MKETELTILIPALNEEKTIGICIEKAQKFIKENNLNAEILIANNMSTDLTKVISEKLGARTIDVKEKGYGSALIEGTKQANGKYIIMGDADDSYNFLELSDFITKLKDGNDLVMGNRLKGKMEKGAMPFLHRYVGTPILTFLVRKKYKINIGDVNCGLRGYNKEKILALNCTCKGMEYASEMIIKAGINNLKITEVPINFYKDKRDKKPHLNPIRDGIRHLKIILN